MRADGGRGLSCGRVGGNRESVLEGNAALGILCVRPKFGKKDRHKTSSVLCRSLHILVEIGGLEPPTC